MHNDRLRKAMDQDSMNFNGLAEAVEVDPKTVWRLRNKGVIPRRVGQRKRVSDVLGIDESDICPAPPRGPEIHEDREVTEEVFTVWTHRADAPKARWWAMLGTAEQNIDLLRLRNAVPA